MGFIPEELIAEVLAYLNVKTILRLKCVSKSWNTLISNPTLVKKHLNKSSQNPHITLKYRNNNGGLSLVFFPVSRLLENPSISNCTLHQLESGFQVVGSCNGLICLVSNHYYATHHQYRCSFWNPSTRTYQDLVVLNDYVNPRSSKFNFMFGYDDSTRTYKVVAYHIEGEDNIASGESEVKVLSVGDGDNCWRNIQSFPVIPLGWRHNQYTHANHLSGTINWLAINNYFYSFYKYSSITQVEQFVIVSLDLSTETYKQYLLPQGFDEVPFVQPYLSVLMGCLCFSHDSRNTEFVLWQMKEYGVQESWTRLFKISKQNLLMHFPAYAFELFCLYINGDTVIFANRFSSKAVKYNLRDQRGETININTIHRFPQAMNYVESLVSVP
ncbi:F-box/kelch-repeat protein At3g23880-like [Trifolium pratense]|uniref:F-box/kelch-repeat protein At3g23880-like n=1 Tax=Trifolium pratense TaxID=57577 RepID=UPI001E697D4A|nr:F-box/kelch-repeat protein At3g23880-like [Trifolium pratense]XP_045805642.1 F-box/kelch-repeat protein At3g23880-like [Trifolium pratense]